jgi:DNA-binding response OmpR family regulator
MLMSGYTQDARLHEGALRSVRVIQKPFTRAALLRKIRTALDAAKPVSRRHTILLAEDDPSYRELIQDTLLSAGFEVLSSPNGTRALLHGLSHAIHLAILDVVMPRGTGFSVCRKLRANPSTASVPIIVMSGLTTKDDQRRALEAGANLFLRKPFSTDELVSTINTLLVKKASVPKQAKLQ